MKSLRVLLPACLIALIAFTACDNGAGTKSTPTPEPTATPAPLTDAEAVAAAKAALAIGYQEGDSASSVTSNLTLASTGTNSVTVAWASSDAARINTAGTVTQPSYGQPSIAVTLTATLSRGDASDTKEFTVTVIPSTSVAFTVAHDWDFEDLHIFDEGHYPTIAVQDENLVCVGTQGDGMLYSIDGGTGWGVKRSDFDGILSDNINDIVISGNLVFMGTFSGLSIWDRTATGSGITNALAGKQVYDVLVDGTNLYLAASDGVYYGAASITPGLVHVSTTFPYPVSVFLSGNSLYAAGDSDELCPEPINVFDTANWGAVPTVIDVNDDDDFAVGPIWADGDRICLGINNSPWYSADGGTSFDYAQPVAGGAITGLIPIGSYLLNVRDGSDLWISADSGANWTSATIPGHDGMLGILANGVSRNGNEILIAHNGGVVIGTVE